MPGEESVEDKKQNAENEDGTAFDLVIGCDGSWSKVRSAMMRVERLVYKLSYPHTIGKTNNVQD